MVIDSLFQKRSQNLPVYLQMYPSPGKKLDTGLSDILVLAVVPPPPEIEIGLNMNAIGTKIISREVIKYILPIYPPLPLPLSDSMPEQETGEFQFQMDIWTRAPSTTPHQPKK